MTFNSPWPFVLFILVFVIGGNLLAYHFGLHTEGPFGYCQGYGCN